LDNAASLHATSLQLFVSQFIADALIYLSMCIMYAMRSRKFAAPVTSVRVVILVLHVHILLLQDAFVHFGPSRFSESKHRKGNHCFIPIAHLPQRGDPSL
jgi:hypothetical protein